MILSAIVAYTKDSEGRYVIGKDGKIPWHITKDMLWFKEHTTDNAIIMGRKTHESIGRILPRRDNIIVTRQSDYEVPGTFVFNDLDAAIEFAAKRNPEIFIIGGEELYNQTIDRVDRLYITFIKDNPGYEGDTFFPEWAETKFRIIHNEKFEDASNGEVHFRIHQRVEYNQKSTVDPNEEAIYNSSDVGQHI